MKCAIAILLGSVMFLGCTPNDPMQKVILFPPGVQCVYHHWSYMTKDPDDPAGGEMQACFKVTDGRKNEGFFLRVPVRNLFVTVDTHSNTTRLVGRYKWYAGDGLVADWNFYDDVVLVVPNQNAKAAWEKHITDLQAKRFTGGAWGDMTPDQQKLYTPQ